MSSTQQSITFQAGEIIFLEGGNSDSLYILEKGEIEVLKGEKVVSTIKGQRTFFGEMAFLLKTKRTATLRAKTIVKAWRVGLSDQTLMDERLAKISISLMKVLATRLNIANEEVKRLESYEDFHQEFKVLSEQNQDHQALLKDLESRVELRQKNEANQLLMNYLTTPWVWTRLEKSLLSMLNRYTKDELSVDSVERYQTQDKLLGTASAISFSGDRNGVMILDIEPNLCATIQKGMGFEDKSLYQDTTQEMSNLVLGELKKKMMERSIELGTPQHIVNVQGIEKLLGDTPALSILVTSSSGNLNLIYQLDLK
jgi:CRP-like cAMP-binding protein